MKYTFKEKDEKLNYLIIKSSDEKFSSIKKEISHNINILIDESAIMLTKSLYADNKSDSILIQKNNCKNLIKLYKLIIKIINYIKLKKCKFNGTIYYSSPSKKQNNNDLMLISMLNIKYNVPLFKKMTTSIIAACDYLDAENSMHNMCDFKNNKCAKHRERNFNTTTGCCPKKCKFMDNCPCKTKNLSCKLILCDYLENKGYYFSPHLLAVLKVNMCYLERVVCWGMFFKSTKKTFAFMWLTRTLIIVVLLTILLKIVEIIVNI